MKKTNPIQFSYNCLLLVVVVVQVLLLLVQEVNCEMRDFRVTLDPDSSVVHYSEGYIVGPGEIDLSKLTFKAIDSIFDMKIPDSYMEDDDTYDDYEGAGEDLGFDDDEIGNDDDDEFEEELDDDLVEDFGDDDGGNRRHYHDRNLIRQNQSHKQQRLTNTKQQQQRATFTNINVKSRKLQQQQQQRHRRVSDTNESVDPGTSQVDIAIVHLPASCANSRSSCDWTELGVGAASEDGDVRWCCAGDAADLGLCKDGPEHYGQLILTDKFNGTHRYVEIPSADDDAGTEQTYTVRYGKVEEEESGQYIVIFANCNDNHGRQVLVEGYTMWKSKHGYLPGELYAFMYFYLTLGIVYCALLVGYAMSMKKNEESRIDIEVWIFATISMGLLEMVARTLDYFYWNVEGTQLLFSIYFGVLIGVIKRAVSRCLVVMVSLGWGVVRDSLGSTMQKIVALGIFYVGVSSVRDFMMTVAVEDVNTLSLQEEDEIFDIVQILTFLVAAVDVIFILWILDGLNGTMEYLENMNQTRKLIRYLRLRCIFLFSVLFAVVWAVFSLVDTYDENGILEEQHEWVVEAATELNYLFILVSVGYLWWPNPAAKEYAYVMELPSNYNDDNDDGPNGEGHELELTGAVVPSAMDDDDENNDQDDDKKYHDGRK